MEEQKTLRKLEYEAPTKKAPPREIKRAPLDLSQLLAPRQHLLYPGESGGLFYTINDSELLKGINLYEEVLKPQLKIHSEQLVKSLKDINRCRTEEGKEAIYSLFKSLAETVMIDAHQNCPKTSSSILFQNNSLMHKSFGKFRANYFDSYSSTKTAVSKVRNDIMKRCGDRFEDSCDKWFKRQGFKRWTQENVDECRKSKSTTLIENEVFYLTEKDLKEIQIEKSGKPENTPDFVFVDINKIPVKIPIIFHPRKYDSDLTDTKTIFQPDFWTTVIEVKTHFILPGITKENDMINIANQLHRYSETFGPTLMLQKRGMTQKMLKYMIEDHHKVSKKSDKEDHERNQTHSGRGGGGGGGGGSDGSEVNALGKGNCNLKKCIAVATIDFKKLPESDLPDPFDVAIKDNHSYVLKQFNIIEKRPHSSMFPNSKENKTLISNYRIYDQTNMYQLFMHDMNVLSQLRIETMEYTKKYFSIYDKKMKKYNDYIAKKQDISLFNLWEGRLFVAFQSHAIKCMDQLAVISATEHEVGGGDGGAEEKELFCPFNDDGKGRIVDNWEDLDY